MAPGHPLAASQGNWDGLAPELLQEVLHCVQPVSGSLRLVCRSWRAAIDSSIITLLPRGRATDAAFIALPGRFSNVRVLDLALWGRRLPYKRAGAAAAEAEEVLADSLAGFRHLDNLSLAGCRRLGCNGSARLLQQIPRCSQLTSLNLSRCTLVDPPYDVCEFKRYRFVPDAKLRRAWTANAKLVPLLPRLTALTQLDLSDCERLASLALPHLGAMPALRQLDVSGTQRLDDTYWAGLAALTQLTALALRGCRPAQGFLAALARLTGLRALDLRWAQLDEDELVPDELTQLQVLTQLRPPAFPSQAQRAALCACIAQLRSLEDLDWSLMQQRAAGAGAGHFLWAPCAQPLPDLRQLTALRRVALHQHQMSPAVAAMLTALPRGATLSLHFSHLDADAWPQLQQEVPSALAALTMLHVDHTALEDGDIAAVAELPQLAHLQLGLPWRGTLPALCGLTAATRLTALSLSHPPDSCVQRSAAAAAAFPAICGLTWLRQLHLACCWWVSNKRLQAASQLHSLTQLGWLGCSLSGDALTALRGLTGLADLAVSCRSASNASLDALACLTALTALKLDGFTRAADWPHAPVSAAHAAHP